MPDEPLTWGLLIATIGRLEILPATVRLALEQTRPPAEILIIDAAEAWRETAAAIEMIVKEHPEVRLVYQPSEMPSLTVQRNLGLDIATADIVFCFDDDSLMFPDCAERIMEVYEADSAGGIVGVQAALTRELPTEVEAFAGSRKQAVSSERLNRVSRTPLGRRLVKRVLMQDIHLHLPPYDGAFHVGEVPASARHLSVAPVGVMHGCRMTYRRAVIDRERFEPTFRRSGASAEDLDASYRASRHGLLLTAQAARLNHFQQAGGRSNRRVNGKVNMCNIAMLLRRNAADQAYARRAYRAFLRRRLVETGLRDALRFRWGFPSLRGLVAGAVVGRRILRMPLDQLETWYPAAQEALRAGRPLPSSPPR